MSKSDYSTSNSSTIPLWVNHENIDFNTSTEMLDWVSNDKVNFMLSDMVYDAMIHSLNEGIDEIVVATIWIKNETSVDVIIRKPNFQQILSSYTERLLSAEKYERLAVIKQQIQKFDLEM